MPGLTLRAATASDIHDVLAFWRTAAEDAHRPADSAQAIAALVARDPGALILALDEAVEGWPGAAATGSAATIVGSVIAGWDGWRCHLYRLAVAPTHRRQGIGRTLVEAAEERFRRLGGTRADAMVLTDNEPAHNAWRACGYAAQSEWSRWIKPLPVS